jgi:hypothetical protein
LAGEELLTLLGGVAVTFVDRVDQQQHKGEGRGQKRQTDRQRFVVVLLLLLLVQH